MRMLGLVVVLQLGFVGGARAQPGAVDPSPYPPPPDGVLVPPPQQPFVPPPQRYVPVQLTEAEYRALTEGEIGPGEHIGGVLLSVGFGFGLGHVAQGRWSDTGWKFTLGETLAVGALIYGAASNLSCIGCDDDETGDALAIGGLLGFMVLRVWEVVDTIRGPIEYNRRLQDLRMRLGVQPPPYARITPFAHGSREAATVGLALSF